MRVSISFYASFDCVDRGLDPLTTNLVVADQSRMDKTICLAVSPSLVHVEETARLTDRRVELDADSIARVDAVIICLQTQ